MDKAISSRCWTYLLLAFLAIVAVLLLGLFGVIPELPQAAQMNLGISLGLLAAGLLIPWIERFAQWSAKRWD